MPPTHPLAPLSISLEDRLQHESWSRRLKTAQALAMPSRIVLLAPMGSATQPSPRECILCSTWWASSGGAIWSPGWMACCHEPRPGTGSRLSDEDVERLLTLTLESTPTNATHWSTRSMAKRSGLSRNSIHRIWQAFSWAAHRSETFKLSRDPLVIDKVRDIAGPYLAPPERALALWVDEKIQIQAPDRTAPLLPMRPGRVERRSHDYARHGTTTLFAALDAQCGERIRPDAVAASFRGVSRLSRHHRAQRAC
jgi:hypothetical protein